MSGCGGWHRIGVSRRQCVPATRACGSWHRNHVADDPARARGAPAVTGPARAERLARWPRALGAVPRFVARDLLLGRLMAGRDGLAEREQREALLVATLLDLSIPARAAEPWDAILPLDAAPLAALGGLSPGACAEAIERLAAAGVLLREPDA